MTDITKNEIGTSVAACRKEKKLTQKQLGGKLNVNGPRRFQVGDGSFL